MVDDGIAIPELAGDVDVGGQSGPLLDGVLGHQTGVVTAAAGHDADPVDTVQLARTEARCLVEDEGPVTAPVAVQRGGHRVGLLVDLLGHVVVVATLSRCSRVPVDLQRSRLAEGARQRGHPHGPGSELDHLIIFEGEEATGTSEQCRDVRGQVRGVVGQTDDQGRHATCGDDGVRFAGVDDGHGEGAVDHSQGEPEALGQGRASGHGRFDKVAQDLRVGLRDQDMAVGQQLGGEGRMVLDDAVVDKGQPAGAVEMGMGVARRRAAMGRPTGVAHTGAAVERSIFAEGAQVVDRMRPLGRPCSPQGSVGREGNAGGVVSPVFEPAQTFEDDG